MQKHVIQLLVVAIFLQNATVLTVITLLRMKELMSSKLNSPDSKSDSFDEENVPLLDIITKSKSWHYKIIYSTTYILLIFLFSTASFFAGYVLCYSAHSQISQSGFGTYRGGFKTEFGNYHCNVIIWIFSNN